MKVSNDILQGYEDTKLIHYNDIEKDFPNTVAYEELGNSEIRGVLKANRYVDGKLIQTYSEKDNHVGVIAATRLGKTTSYVIPTLLSFAKAKKKRSMFISDPKGEIYRITAETLRQEGYNVRLINFRDYTHSEYWNPLTPIYDMYQKAYYIEDEVEVVETKTGPKNIFNGVIYDSQRKLDTAIKQMKRIAMENVANEIDHLASRIITTERKDDPYWEDSARELLKAGIWALLEDSHPTSRNVTPITKDTFSFSTLLSIMDSMRDDNGGTYNDNGFFSSRGEDSRAYILAKNCILENGHVTRKCIVSSFNTKMAVYKNSTVRLVTSCNSFDMEELTDETKPIALFIDYRDESKAHYQVISSFVQSAYSRLIEYANNKESGKLDNAFYFILDEAGNLPAIPEFETVISACAGRNIYFILILQSYAQLNNVYGKDVSEIIRDNLNMHVFIGSNNPETLHEFSKECGEITRISPVSALSGNKDEIDNYHIETIPLMPKSKLSSLKQGECIVTEANCGYVMLSKLERYYVCDEMNNLPKASENEYHCNVNPLEDKYIYKYKKGKVKRNYDFDF